ncbi:hypothetical protein HYALB_00001808 [Hymenoscyphus albidus]|uniref:Uncharacterized protein n=1 Tax=Hymenoscyphus albidus TaxID=595503 RepID=A0A9N9LQE0_9HELO|nr:hypothetical protein HYALB_00001808 [Hymenoscyphus albidus]
MSSSFSRLYRIVFLAFSILGAIATDDSVESRPVIAETEANTYWIDSSCTTKLDDPIQEAILMASRAATRLFDGNDALAGAYLNRLFKMPGITSGAKDETRSMDNFQLIAELKQTTERSDARIRLYCDNDGARKGSLAKPGEKGARWQLTRDLNRPGKQNSKRIMGKNQEWEEVVNGVRTDIDWAVCGYKNKSARIQSDHLAMTVGEKVLPGYPGEVWPRFVTTVSMDIYSLSISSITDEVLFKVCDVQFSNFPTVAHLADENKDFSALTKGIFDLELITSFIMLHERKTTGINGTAHYQTTFLLKELGRMLTVLLFLVYYRFLLVWVGNSLILGQTLDHQLLVVL